MLEKSNTTHKSQLPSILDYKYVKDEVVRLIKNKIQPLAYKQYVLKSGRWANGIENAHKSLYTQKSNIESGDKKKSILKKRESKQNCIKLNKHRRRKAVVEVQSNIFDRSYFLELQSKVEKHIILKKMNLMENQYTYAKDCGKKQKQEICMKLRTSPMQKYLRIFERAERPSEKVRLLEESSCEKMLKQIKSAKSIKHIQYVDENLTHLVNMDQKKKLNWRKAQPPIDEAYTELKLRKQNRKLRNEIMSDIHKEYETQGSSKIRISINHKKMIQIL